MKIRFKTFLLATLWQIIMGTALFIMADCFRLPAVWAYLGIQWLFAIAACLVMSEGAGSAFHLPILARDAVQEAPYDTLGNGSREYNRLLSRAGMAVIWRMLQHFSPDAAVIIDTWCRYPSFDWLTVGLKSAGITRFMEVFCWAQGEMLAQRYLNCVSLRHPGHPGKELARELIEVAKKPNPPAWRKHSLWIPRRVEISVIKTSFNGLRAI